MVQAVGVKGELLVDLMESVEARLIEGLGHGFFELKVVGTFSSGGKRQVRVLLTKSDQFTGRPECFEIAA